MYFRNEPLQNYCEVFVSFTPTLPWKPPNGELLEIIREPIHYSNLSTNEWQARRFLADDHSIVVKRANKGSCIVTRDKENYPNEVEN